MGIPYLDPTVEELLWLNNQSAPVIPQAPFFLPFVTSISEGRFPGSGTPTFTRALAAYQTDFEGKLNLVPSGATREQGARYVRNWITGNSEDASTWTKDVGTTVTLQADGSYKAVLPANTLNTLNPANGATFPATGLALGSIWIKADASTSVYLSVGNGAGTIQTAITVSTSWQLWSPPTRSASGVANITFGFETQSRTGGTNYGETTLYVGGPGHGAQLEDVVGQTITAPSERVSVGVLSAPWHGANVDGVKYFSTLNGNTVSSNVVTEATGAHIDSSQAAAAGGVTAGVVDATGPLGLLVEGARTNDILQSNTLDTTWTVSNAADMNAVAADAYVSTDGTTTMDKLQPKATNAVHSLNQAFTFTAAKYTFAMDLRYVSATPQRWVALILNDGTTTWGASFDLSLGVVGAVSAGATSTIKATALANVYRVSVTNTANAAAAAGTVKISLNATDTATLESAVRAGTETLGAGMVQHEIGTFESSPIPTTTVAVTRPADALTYPTASNFSDTAGSMYAEVGYTTWANAGGTAIGSATQGLMPIADHNGVQGYDGTNTVQGAVGTPANVVKMAATWTGTAMTVGAAGTTPTVGTYDGAWNLTTIGIGSGINGTIRNVRIWQQSLNSTQLVMLTR